MTTETTNDFLDRFTFHTQELAFLSTGGYLEQCKDCPRDIDYEAGVSYTDEPSFSWSACDTCGSTLGGNREVGHAWVHINDVLGDVIVHLSCCTDCVVFIANGDLPEEPIA